MILVPRPPRWSSRSEAIDYFGSRGAALGFFLGIYTFLIAVHTGSPGDMPGPIAVFRMLRDMWTGGTGSRIFSAALLLVFGILGALLWAVIGAVGGWILYETSSRSAD